jgi:hypothetical protein
MTAKPKETTQSQDDRLEEELEDSFPASDPPSMTQPKTHAGAPPGKKTPEDAARKAVKELEMQDDPVDGDSGDAPTDKQAD